MKKIVFALMMVLFMSSANYASVILDYVDNGSVGTGLHGYTVTATGIGITTLAAFTIEGNVNQEFAAPYPFTQSEWLGNGSADPNSSGLDSYVIFGNQRIIGYDPDTYTIETVLDSSASGPGTLNNCVGVSGGGGSTWSMGDFNCDGIVDIVDATFLAINYTAVSRSSRIIPVIIGDVNLDGYVNDDDIAIMTTYWQGNSDAYLKTGVPSTNTETVELLYLVLADGESIDIDLMLLTATNHDPSTGTAAVYGCNLSLSIVPEPGVIVMLLAAGLWFFACFLRNKLFGQRHFA